MRVLFLTFFDPDNYGVRCLASYLQRNGHDVHILQIKSWIQTPCSRMPNKPAVLYAYTGTLWMTDIPEDAISPVELQLCATAVARWKPDVIGISVRGVLHHIFPRIVQALKQACPKSFLVGGGVGPTLEPAFLLGLGVDAVIRGEGEEALLDLVTALEQGTPWQGIKNLTYATADGLVQNPLRPLMTQFERFPLPLDDPQCFSCIECNSHVPLPMDRTAFPRNPLYMGQVIYSIMTSRGCIGQCSYCSTPAVHRLYRKDHKKIPRLRLRSLASVMEELEGAKQRGATQVIFYDDFVIHSTTKLCAFFSEYKEKINLPFIANFHPQQLNKSDKLLKCIIDAGILYFAFGLQTADDVFCKKIYRRNRYINDYGPVCKKIQKYGVNIIFQFIGGNPLATEVEFEKNVAFFSQFAYDHSHQRQVNCVSHYLQIYPGANLQSMFPGIKTMPRSPHDWLHKSILLNMCRLVSKETIQTLLHDSEYKADSAKLQHLRNCIARDKHHWYVFKEIERLQGKEVYFWGYGDLYRHKRHLFQGVKPQCILVDTLGNHPDSVDGIPVRHPDEVLDGSEILPIVVFGRDQNTVYRKILSKYPMYVDVVSCAIL